MVHEQQIIVMMEARGSPGRAQGSACVLTWATLLVLTAGHISLATSTLSCHQWVVTLTGAGQWEQCDQWNGSAYVDRTTWALSTLYRITPGADLGVTSGDPSVVFSLIWQNNATAAAPAGVLGMVDPASGVVLLQTPWQHTAGNYLATIQVCVCVCVCVFTLHMIHACPAGGNKCHYASGRLLHHIFLSTSRHGQHRQWAWR
jgi:hypothetical protein